MNIPLFRTWSLALGEPKKCILLFPVNTWCSFAGGVGGSGCQGVLVLKGEREKWPLVGR